MREDSFARVLRHISRFFIFFLLVSFVVTCAISVFLGVMSEAVDIEYNEENISLAAKATMGIVVVLSVAFYTIDSLRRAATVERPAKKIIEASERIMKGDFSYRIPIRKPRDTYDEFDEIAERINKMAEELSSIETLRTDFIANVSHEIKTPLAIMSNYASLIQSDSTTPSERREYARSISSASMRLSSLVTNILKLNKLENQQIVPKREVYDLSEQICECLLQFESAWEEKGIEIETDIDEDVRVENDAEMMSIVWNNLISNAIKFTDEGGRVKVCVRADGSEACVSVSDTGCGISGATGDHIFEKFYQGDTSRKESGNGLGLALVKRVIDITRGSISVESELGVGTTFEVRIRRAV